jgi:hypothetical protein
MRKQSKPGGQDIRKQALRPAAAGRAGLSYLLGRELGWVAPVRAERLAEPGPELCQALACRHPVARGGVPFRRGVRLAESAGPGREGIGALTLSQVGAALSRGRGALLGG